MAKLNLIKVEPVTVAGDEAAFISDEICKVIDRDGHANVIFESQGMPAGVLAVDGKDKDKVYPAVRMITQFCDDIRVIINDTTIISAGE